MRVLGVALTDPLTLSSESGLAPIRAKLRERVVTSLQRLMSELEAGEDRSVAFFMARRFVFPNLM